MILIIPFKVVDIKPLHAKADSDLDILLPLSPFGYVHHFKRINTE